MAENRDASGDEPLGLKKFNSTSVSTTTEILTPQLSGADKSRRASLMAAAALALALVGWLAFRATGLNPFERTENQRPFQPPVHGAP